MPEHVMAGKNKLGEDEQEDGTMLLTRDILFQRLEEHLKKSDQIDVAVAWATDCNTLERLCIFASTGGSLRAIVGIGGNATHPNALRSIQQCAKLRIASSVEGPFHPKFYLFHQPHHRIGLIGSADLTRSGFEQNEELIFEFSDDDRKATQWFNDRWKSLGDDEDCSRTLDKYEQGWKPPSGPPRTPRRYEIPIVDGEIYGIARGLTDWSSFVAAIDKADEYWGALWDVEDPVTGETSSWLRTITLGRAVIRRKDWNELSTEDYHLIVGRGFDYGLLGGFGAAGKAASVFLKATPQHLEIRQTIRAALQPVLDADDTHFAKTACDFIREVDEIPNFGARIATRLLALARPDRAISVNQGSAAGLAALTQLPQATLGRAPHGRGHSYIDLLHWFEDRDWYSNPNPGDVRERLLARTRAALFDAFVYHEP